MKKIIEFTSEEDRDVKVQKYDNNITNAFGHVFVPKPPTYYNETFTTNYSPQDIGKLFIEVGELLMKEQHKITNLEVKSLFKPSIIKKGTVFNLKFLYETVEEN